MNDDISLKAAGFALASLIGTSLGWWGVWHEMRRSPSTIGLFKLLALSHIIGGLCIIIYLALHIVLCGASTTWNLFRSGDVGFLFRTGAGFLLFPALAALWLVCRKAGKKAKYSVMK